MKYSSINLSQKLSLFDGVWQPKVIAEMNDYQFKLAKLQGEFVWHKHQETDETFIVLKGVLTIDFRDGSVEIAAGEMFVVPKGVEHRPWSKDEVQVMLVEPRGVVNTGSSENHALTANSDVWI
jgi:mannose-6-phosphate isomerase-like protein (cupin superfamily)